MNENEFEFVDLGDVERLEKASLSEHDLPSSTYEILCRSAVRYGNHTALQFLFYGTPDVATTTYSYSELLSNVTKTANALNALGVQKNNVVSSLLPNIPQTHFTFWGAEAAGIYNPINPMLDVQHIVAIANDVQTKVLITLAPGGDGGLYHKALAIKSLAPSIETLLLVDLSQFMLEEHAEPLRRERKAYLSENVLDFDTFTSQFEADELDSDRVFDLHDTASYFHTGGTTGTPKIAPHSHKNEVMMAWQVATAMGVNHDDVTLCGLPLFHVHASFINGLGAWFAGATVLLAAPEGYRNKKLIQHFWHIVEKHEVSYFSVVPTILSSLLEVPIQDHDVSSLKFCICGAAPLASELMKKFENSTGLAILEGYGQTEGTCASTVNPRYGEHRAGSVGIRLPYMQMKTVVVDEQGKRLRDCEVNESGVIVISGPLVFDGYLKAEQNNDVWVEEGWFNTGDLGRFDQQGYLWLTGRSKDLIIRGGHNIDPKIIEEALYAHDDVAEVAAVAKPDARVGEVPVAYVQLKSGSVITAEKLLDFCAMNISERAALPKEIIFIAAMPITDVGKIYKPTLRCDQIQRVVERELHSALGDDLDFEVIIEVTKQDGDLARISVKELAQAESLIKKALDQYHFKYQLTQSP